MEKATGEDRRALFELANLSSDLIGFCGIEGDLQFLNRAGREMIGLDESAALPISLAEFIDPADSDLLKDLVLPVAIAEGVWHGTMRLIERGTGTVIPVRRSTYARFDERGDVAGFISVMRHGGIREVFSPETAWEDRKDAMQTMRNSLFGMMLSLEVLKDRATDDSSIRSIAICTTAVDRMARALVNLGS